MMIALAIIAIGLLSSSVATGIGKVWDVSPDQSSHEEITSSSWPRLDLSAFEVRSISGIGRVTTREYFPPQKKNSRLGMNREEIVISNESTNDSTAKEAEDMESSISPAVLYDHHPLFTGVTKNSHKDVELLAEPVENFQRHSRTGRYRGHCSEDIEDDNDEMSMKEINKHLRVRRELEENDMEKISGTKNVREPRLNSPESWSKQPLSIEFRHQTNLDDIINDENVSSRIALKNNHQAPRVDFITANRRNFNEVRESRDLPISRSSDEGYYRNNIRDANSEMPYPRNYHYPEHFRTEREYFVRGLNEPVAFSQERYRIEDFDLYRNRPTPKPKRIIYYATLPEVVRKPVDLRTYPRPYESMGRVPLPPINRDGMYKRLPGIANSRYRYRSSPYGSGYDSYDPYMKKFDYQERPFVPYNDRIDEDHYREQDFDHASFKDVARSDEPTESSSNIAGMRRNHDKLPWPIQIGTEINVKDNQRVTGRKIFGQQEFDRFRPSARIEREDNGESNRDVDDKN